MAYGMHIPLKPPSSTDTSKKPTSNTADASTEATTASTDTISQVTLTLQSEDAQIYLHRELQELLDNTKLEEWREDIAEGCTKGKKYGTKKMQEKCEDSLHEGIKQGMRLGEYKEQEKWLAEGHRPGLCIDHASPQT